MSVSSIYGGGSSSDDYSYYKAHEAEKEAANRIKAAQELAQKTEIQQNAEIEQLRDRFEKNYEIQNLKQNQILDDQKSKGYEQLRDLHRSQQADLNRTLGESQTIKEQTEKSTREELHKLDKLSQDKIQKTLAERIQQVDFEKNRSDEELEAIKNQNRTSIEKIRDDGEQRVQAIQKDHQSAIQQLLETSQETKERAQTQNESFLKKTIEEQRQSLGEIYQQSNQKLREIRQDTSQKIAAYTSRQNDPFYKLMTLDAQLKDEGKDFVLTVTIPEYEQEHISAVIRGDQLVLSGYRKNEESLKDPSGHSQETTAYQSFHESFPLSWPVDPKRLTREHKDDQVIIRVPKMSQFTFREPTREKLQSSHLEAPNFPHNIGKTTSVAPK